MKSQCYSLAGSSDLFDTLLRWPEKKDDLLMPESDKHKPKQQQLIFYISKTNQNIKKTFSFVEHFAEISRPRAVPFVLSKEELHR